MMPMNNSEFNMLGERTKGYANGGPVQPDDQAQSLDMIKQALMKVIQDMTALESDRHLPDGHPLKMKAVVDVKPGDEASPDADMSGTSEDVGAGDPKDLDDMMSQADSADAEGSMPDEQDHTHGLPPEVMDAVNKKKALMGK